MKLHLPSVLLTVGVLGLVALTSSQSPLLPTGFRIEYLPHPRDYVQIKEGTPYTVPAGKLFVLTGLGGERMANPASLLVDGVEEVVAGMYTASSTGGIVQVSTVVAVPPGLTVHASATISVQGGSTAPEDARAWGYLASQ